MVETYTYPEALRQRTSDLLEEARRRRLRLTCAESCTGGLLGGLLTDVSGSADCVDCGFVVYSNRSKEDLLGVPGELLTDHGAVSQAVALAMAEGAVARSHAHVGVSITGIAGPGGGTEEKPVGLVYFGCARQDRETVGREERFGDVGRAEVRTAALEVALHMLWDRVTEEPAPADAASSDEP